MQTHPSSSRDARKNVLLFVFLYRIAIAFVPPLTVIPVLWWQGDQLQGFMTYEAYDI